MVEGSAWASSGRAGVGWLINPSIHRAVTLSQTRPQSVCIADADGSAAQTAAGPLQIRGWSTVAHASVHTPTHPHTRTHTRTHARTHTTINHSHSAPNHCAECATLPLPLVRRALIPPRRAVAGLAVTTTRPPTGSTPKKRCTCGSGAGPPSTRCVLAVSGAEGGAHKWPLPTLPYGPFLRCHQRPCTACKCPCPCHHHIHG